MTASESQPLLPTNGPNAQTGKKRWGTPWTRFFRNIGFGVLFIIIFNLVFLGRSSSRRDWFRIHGNYVTDADVERTLFTSITEEEVRSLAKEYTKGPHLAGKGLDLVEFTKSKFEEYGLETEVTPYYTYLNYPLDHSLTLLDSNGTTIYKASLEEDVLKEDPTTGLADRIPTFHGYSASGNVTAKFIYANYGRKEDFDKLVEEGIEVKGKIVIVRYDRLFRGLKVKFAEELGAVGAIIFSDPTDDGGVDFAHGYAAYPEGPARNPSSVQRGSVMYLSYAPGDPTTPGYPSTSDAVRQDPHHAIPKIPSLPISYKEALPILKSLNGLGPKGSDFGKDWDGILDVDYSIGPSKDELNLYNLQNFTTPAIHNVIGTYEGIFPDEVIVVGNHRDAWIAGGAGDPNSGTAVLLAFAKALGKLKKLGWRPNRTIILASWDGEEYALLGSTEWGEDKAKFLGRKALAYINLDVAVSGTHFGADASPSLNQLLRDVTARVPHPQVEDKTLYDVWKESNGARIGTLGTGSDYTVFIDHLGIPSIDFGFGPAGNDAVYHYHSNYDSFHWMDNFVNDSWAFHVAATQTMGLLSITLAQQVVVDFRFKDYGEVLSQGLEKLISQYGSLFNLTAIEVDEEDKLEVQNQDSWWNLKRHYYDHRYDNNHYDNNRDNNRNDRRNDDRNNHNNNDNRNHNDQDDNDNDQHNHGRNHKTPTTPKQALRELRHALQAFHSKAKKADAYSRWLLDEYNTDYPWWKLYKKISLFVKIKLHNIKIGYLERVFLYEDGLDNRAWFKHIFFAPNRYLGYGGAVFPGILESFQDNKPQNFIRWAVISRDALWTAVEVFRRY